MHFYARIILIIIFVHAKIQQFITHVLLKRRLLGSALSVDSSYLVLYLLIFLLSIDG